MVSAVTWIVEIAFSGDLTGLFRLDISTLDGTDVLGGTFGGNVYDDVTAYLKGLSVWRGRDSDMSVMRKGGATIVLHDPTGRFNPENPTSPLVGLLLEMRPVRIRATHLGVTYGVYAGYIESIVHDPGDNERMGETVIECVDLFEWLETCKPVIAATGATTVGAAIGLLLDAMEWTDPDMRDLDTGDTIPDFPADGTASIVSLIEGLLEVDRGVFFVSGSGVATYQDRSSHWANRAADGNLTATVLSGVRPGISVRQVVNRQTVTRTGGVAQTVTDEESRKRDGYRDGTPITSAYLIDDNQALSLASFLVGLQRNGLATIQPATIYDIDDVTIVQQLAREIGDVVTVTEPVGGTSFTGFIEGLRLDAPEILGPLQARFLVSKRQASAFTIGVSVLDGPDVLGY